MTCEHATQLIHLDRPGERTESEEHQLRTHLRTCEACRAEHEIVRRSASGMDTFLRSGVPAPHVAKETGRILRTIGSYVAPFDPVDWIIGVADRRAARIAYAAASLALLAVLALQMSESGSTSARPAVRTGPYLAYRVDARQLAELPLSDELRRAFSGHSEIEIRTDQLATTNRVLGQAVLHSITLTEEQRNYAATLIASWIRSSEPQVRFGTIGG